MKCPKRIEYTYVDAHNGCTIYVYAECIGAECAAYREYDNGQEYKDKWKARKQWFCAMMPQELWHDVEVKP